MPSARVQAERDVVGERVGEQERLLRHEADRAAQRRERDVADVDAVDEHRAGRRIVQPREQGDQRRLARAGDADERDGLPRLDPRGHVVEHRRAAVGEDEIAEFDLAADADDRASRETADASAGVARVAASADRDLQSPARVSRTSSIRFHDAMPRCSMLVTQPNAIIGQLEHRQIRVERDELADRDAPADDFAAAQPEDEQRAEPEEEAHAGEEEPLKHDQARDCGAGTPRSTVGTARARPLLPVGAHDADARERLLRDRADLRELRLNLLEAAVNAGAESLTEIDTNGSGMSDHSVSRASIESIRASAATNVSIVFAEYMIDGPIIMRTAFRSLVARDIRSPVRCAWKYDSGSVCRCAKKSFRMSYSMSRDAPMRIRRVRNRKTPPTRPIASSSAAVAGQLAAGDAARQIVDREAQNQRPGQRDRRS